PMKQLAAVSLHLSSTGWGRRALGSGSLGVATSGGDRIVHGASCDAPKHTEVAKTRQTKAVIPFMIFSNPSEECLAHTFCLARRHRGYNEKNFVRGADPRAVYPLSQKRRTEDVNSDEGSELHACHAWHSTWPGVRQPFHDRNKIRLLAGRKQSELD